MAMKPAPAPAAKAKAKRPPAFKLFTRYFYRSSAMSTPALDLVEIPQGRVLDAYVPRGVLELTVQNFNVKALVRNIRECSYDSQSDDSVPGGPTRAHPLPPLTYTFPTRWDMDAGRLIQHRPSVVGVPTLAPPQRVLVKIILADPLLDFMPDVPAITAKDQESASVLANLATSVNPLGQQVARFWCLFDGGSAPRVIAGFNIALLITDRNDSSFVLPIIVDPKIPNRG